MTPRKRRTMNTGQDGREPAILDQWPRPDVCLVTLLITRESQRAYPSWLRSFDAEPHMKRV